jgi:hypothetical protein
MWCQRMPSARASHVCLPACLCCTRTAAETRPQGRAACRLPIGQAAACWDARLEARQLHSTSSSTSAARPAAAPGARQLHRPAAAAAAAAADEHLLQQHPTLRPMHHNKLQSVRRPVRHALCGPCRCCARRLEPHRAARAAQGGQSRTGRPEPHRKRRTTATCRTPARSRRHANVA